MKTHNENAKKSFEIKNDILSFSGTYEGKEWKKDYLILKTEAIEKMTQYLKLRGWEDGNYLFVARNELLENWFIVDAEFLFNELING